ncbi:RNA-directed DNA polymerase [Mycolicibacterium psychrotolerans]|uniref:RNA-directed DNA polymerase n=1 Tax=Mycolicibacterium psychrotolerans TaxID=216929 RepID=UPI003D66892D
MRLATADEQFSKALAQDEPRVALWVGVTGMDWAKALDFKKAAHNVKSEFVGDWHLDPWGWPEIDFVVSTAPHFLAEHLKSNIVQSAALIDVPKENWGSRPAVVLDVLDRLAYQALVDRLSVDLIGELPTSVYGWRLPPDSVDRGAYSHNSLQWEVYRDHLKSATMFFDSGLRTDLVSCFASIPIDLVQGAIDDRVAKGNVSRRLFSFLEGISRIPARSGLPQRSLASAVIANMYLSPLDDVLDHFAQEIPTLELFESKKTTRRRSWTRWMDDVWLFGGGAADLRRAQVELQDIARSIGMNINSAKTEVVEGEKLSEAALQVEHSAVDDALLLQKDATPLEELVDRLLDDPRERPELA